MGNARGSWKISICKSVRSPACCEKQQQTNKQIKQNKQAKQTNKQKQTTKSKKGKNVIKCKEKIITKQLLSILSFPLNVEIDNLLTLVYGGNHAKNA